jgi:hypothetical protein
MTLKTKPMSASEARAIHLVDELTDDLDESLRKLTLRLNLLDDKIVFDLKRYFQKMHGITLEMEQAATKEIARLAAQPHVQHRKLRHPRGIPLGAKSVSPPAAIYAMNQVIKLQWLDGVIAFFAMEDRASKNRSSEEFMSGKDSAFRAIQGPSCFLLFRSNWFFAEKIRSSSSIPPICLLRTGAQNIPLPSWDRNPGMYHLTQNVEQTPYPPHT